MRVSQAKIYLLASLVFVSVLEALYVLARNDRAEQWELTSEYWDEMPIDQVKKLVREGRRDAMVELGWRYIEFGDEELGEDRFRIAEKWFVRASDRGSIGGMISLGLLYRSERVGEGDQDKEFYWFWQAADLGSPIGFYYIAENYYTGRGVRKDQRKARAHFRRSAEMGNRLAMGTLGLMLLKGEGGGVDYEKALEWFQRGAKAGSRQSMRWLGHIFEHGIPGVSSDQTLARKWYQKAATGGDTQAMVALAEMYLEERKRERGYDAFRSAIDWLRKAASAGDMDAMQRLISIGDTLGGEENLSIDVDKWREKLDRYSKFQPAWRGTPIDISFEKWLNTREEKPKDVKSGSSG